MCSDELFFQNERLELLQDALLAFGVEVRMHLIRCVADLHFKRILSAEFKRRDTHDRLSHTVTPLPCTTISVALLFQQVEAGDDIVFNLPVGVACREVLLEPIPPQSDLLSLIGLFFRHD